MDSPMLAWVGIVVGALIVLVSLFADPLGLGRHPGFGWMQGLGVIIGALVILAGAYLWWRRSLRGKMSP